MKVFTCNDHEGYWPVPTASVIIAENEKEARDMLHEQLLEKGLNKEDFTLVEVNTSIKQVITLSDGEY